MRKQDRQGARTPADVERRFRGVPQEIEKIKTTKITADRLEIHGEEMDIKVAATNITGKLTADQIDAKGLTVEAANITGTLKAEQVEGIEMRVNAADIQGTLTADQIDADGMIAEDVDITGTVTALKGQIGAWYLGQTNISVNPSEIITDYALYTDEMYDSAKGVTYQVYLTAKGVYVSGRDNTGASYFANKTWLDICGG